MRKGRKEKIEQEVEIIEAVCCNKCGKAFENKDWVGKVHEFYIDFTNYFSKFDYEKWRFDLCEDCILEIVKTFKFVPEGFLQPTVEPQFIKNPQEVFDEFKRTNEWNPLMGYSEEELKQLKIEDAYEEKETDIREELRILNSFAVEDVSANDEIEYVLIEQTNEFCLFLEKMKPFEWETYLMENGDGEFVDIAPLAWELGASKFTKEKKFH